MASTDQFEISRPETGRRLRYYMDNEMGCLEWEKFQAPELEKRKNG
jgi:hypothetical protein